MEAPGAPAQPPRPSSTRGRPPTYAATTLDPVCHAWFQEPTRDPRIPAQTIGVGHQNHYKDACLRRILEIMVPPEERPDLTVADIQEALADYLRDHSSATEAQRDFLLTEYYTDAYLNTFHTAYMRAYGTPGASPSSSPVPVSALSHAFQARFEPIQSQLKKLKRFTPFSVPTIGKFLGKLKNTIQTKLVPAKDPEYLPYKVNLTAMVFLLKKVVYLILSLEQTKYLKPRYIANLLADLKDWEVYKPKPTYPMTHFKHHMAVFLQYLNIYLDTKTNLGKLYLKLTPDELLKLLRAIKVKCITLYGLQAFANTPAFIQLTLDFIKTGKSRETYQYMWFLLTERGLTYPKRVYPPLPQNLLETACIQRYASIHDRAAALKNTFTERCSALVQTDCVALTAKREKLMKTLMRKYQITSPANSEDLINAFPVRVRRPHALMDFFKQWVAHAVIGKHRIGFWLQYLDVKFEGEEGYFIGVQTDLLQTCMDALHPAKSTFATPLFLPVEDGSARFRFARSIAFHKHDHDAFQGFLDLNTAESQALFYEFVGGLMARCFLEHIEAPVKLSYFTLAYLCTNRHLEPEDYGFYFAMDMPAAANSYINLLAYDASVIDALELTPNDVYPLHTAGSSSALTADTLVPFIHAFGQYALTVAQPGDPAVIPVADAAKYAAAGDQYMSLLNAWTKGFFINLSHTRAREETLIRLIDPLISTGGTMDTEQLAQWARHKVLPGVSTMDGTPKRTQEIAFQMVIFLWVIDELLGNPLLPLPYDAILPEGTPPPATPEAKKQFYYKNFIPQLLYFWTGSRTINMDYTHTVQFILNDPTDVPNATQKYERLNAHPLAHTCSKTLDIPTYLIDFSRQKAKHPEKSLEQVFQRIPEERMLRSYLLAKNDRWKTILLRRLCTAMYQSSGFGMAGGHSASGGRAKKIVKKKETRKTKK